MPFSAFVAPDALPVDDKRDAEGDLALPLLAALAALALAAPPVPRRPAPAPRAAAAPLAVRLPQLRAPLPASSPAPRAPRVLLPAPGLTPAVVAAPAAARCALASWCLLTAAARAVAPNAPAAPAWPSPLVLGTLRSALVLAIDTAVLAVAGALAAVLGAAALAGRRAVLGGERPAPAAFPPLLLPLLLRGQALLPLLRRLRWPLRLAGLGGGGLALAGVLVADGQELLRLPFKLLFHPLGQLAEAGDLRALGLKLVLQPC
mmetsp:Transcript_112670/g.273607  ORF Transcript_112670/g.273607 Transcript_112670/m.273607 type:complete len:261 (-) Transcript_112670:233-1015(-)